MHSRIDTWQRIAGRQRGAAAVEFAFVAILFFVLLLAIIEFGRLMYLWNSVQEVTRRAAREAVVNWVDQRDAIRTLVLHGGTSFPAGAELTADSIAIDYLDRNRDPIEEADLPATPQENIDICLVDGPNCIRYVRVSIDDVNYVPMVGIFAGAEFDPFNIDLDIPLPESTVVMPAEALGYRPS